nr:AP-5 complex subunit beta-1 [Tanacetum cinerariifolium]
MERSSATQEYPSLIDTFFMAHTVNGEEMRRLEAMGTYTDDEINRLARRGKQRGHIPGVGRFEEEDESGSGSSLHLSKRNMGRFHILMFLPPTIHLLFQMEVKVNSTLVQIRTDHWPYLAYIDDYLEALFLA